MLTPSSPFSPKNNVGGSFSSERRTNQAADKATRLQLLSISIQYTCFRKHVYTVYYPIKYTCFRVCPTQMLAMDQNIGKQNNDISIQCHSSNALMRTGGNY